MRLNKINHLIFQKNEPSAPFSHREHIFLNEHALWGALKSTAQDIKAKQKENLIINLLYKSEFENLKSHLEKINSSIIVPLKGLALIDTLYDNSSQRKMSDVDLYVPDLTPADLQNLLPSLGYQKVKEQKWKANRHKVSYEVQRPLAPLTFEFHFQLYNHSDYSPQLINKTKSIYLSKEDELAYLCYHLAEQHNFIKLFWLYDICLYLKKYSSHINEVKLLKIAKQLNIERSVSCCLFVCQKYFNVTFEPPIKKPPYWVKKSLNQSFLCYPRKNFLKYFLLKYYLKDKRAFNYFCGRALLFFAKTLKKNRQ